MFCSYTVTENITDNVAVSVDQFYTIRAVLMSSIEEEEEKEEEEEHEDEKERDTQS